MKSKFVLIVLLHVFMISCTNFNANKYQYTEGKIYGTYYHVSYASSKNLDKEIRREMERVNTSLSMFDTNSLISKINRNECVETDSLFRKMYRMAHKVYLQTEGGYDITVAPLVNAWGFGLKKGVSPEPNQVDSLLAFVGMDKLVVENHKIIKKNPAIKLDASSIAKGLGVDLVAEFFERQNIQNYMVEIGGEVRVKGQSEKKRSWRIGIDRPEEDIAGRDRQLEMILSLNSGALATSGNYRNFYIHKGKKIVHTINPKTGYPVQTEVLSASVFAPSCMEADAYATGFMVIGLEKSRKIIESNPKLEGCLIYEVNGKLDVWISEGLKSLLVP